MKAKAGSMVYIQSYKYNGSLHRTWSKGYVLKHEGPMSVVITFKTWVIESDGRRWYTREPAICFFFENKWYNIISMIRRNGIYYYCNIATPSIYDGESIKNIDLDLDIKVYPDYRYEILDEDEFLDHQVSMEYSEDIIRIAKEATKQLSRMIEKKEFPFNHGRIMDLFDEYQNRGSQ